MSTYANLAEELFFEKLSNRPASKAHQKALEMGLFWLAGPYYSTKKGGETTHKAEGDKIVPVEEKEKTAQKTTSADEPTKPTTKSPGEPTQKLGGPIKRVPRKKVQGPSNYDVHQFSVALSKRREDSISKFNRSPNLKAIQSELEPEFNKFYGELDAISKLSKGKKRKAELERFVTNFSITVGDKKIYANHFTSMGGLYKVFGDTLSKEAQYLLYMLEDEGIPIIKSTSKKKNARYYLAGQSKPNYGRVHKYTDPSVERIFSTNPILNDLAENFKSLYGPTGPDGNLLRSGGKNASEYFAHSVESNKSVTRTIKALESFAETSGQMPDDATGYAGVANALRRYRKHMETAAIAFDGMPPKERAEIVGRIYEKLAHDMHVADKGVASAIMKNMAEQALYDTEIAAGDEVYLPSEGNFPSGDKIVVNRNGTQIEKIETISVKFGKNSNRSYGMPSEAAKVCLYHPDKQMRDILAGGAGRSGYELGVNGTVIHDQGSFQKMATLSGISDAFEPEILEQIRTLGIEMTLITKKVKRNHPKSKNGEVPVAELGTIQNDPAMQDAWSKLHALIKRGDEQIMLDVMGEYNYKNMMKPDVNAMAFYSLMTFGAALRTSNGFPTLLHNHQEYADGEFISKTVEGTPDLKHWPALWQPYGERSGGLKVGYNRHANDTPTTKRRI